MARLNCLGDIALSRGPKGSGKFKSPKQIRLEKAKRIAIVLDEDNENKKSTEKHTRETEYLRAEFL